MNPQIEWQVPRHEVVRLAERRHDICVCVPVLNEGERIRRQLARMSAADIAGQADILIADGGSTDGSLALEYLREHRVNALLTKRGPGKLSAQLRMVYAFALREGYGSIITVDGNGKDSVESVPLFIERLRAGDDLVQGSRYLPGGAAINTPRARHWGVKLIHIPVTNALAGYRYTDTTNGFRGYSRRLLLDARVQPFRDVFDTYELLAYLSVRAPRLGFRVSEVPVRREYPREGKTPTKISPLRGNLLLLHILANLARGRYNP